MDRKVAYDRQLANAPNRENEEKFVAFILFTLRDNVLTKSERDDLLDEARKLGIPSARAETLIKQNLQQTGSHEGAETPVPGNRTPPAQPTASAVPELAVNQTAFDLGTLARGERRRLTVTIDNRGGGVLAGAIHSSNPEWLTTTPAEIDASRHHQEIAIEVSTKNLDLGKHYVGMLEIDSNGGRTLIRVSLSVEIQAVAVSRSRTRLFLLGAIAGAAIGWGVAALFPYPSALGTAHVAGLVGYFALITAGAFAGKWWGGIGAFIAALVLNSVAEHASLPAFSVITWAELGSVFLYFWAKPLLVAKLAGNNRRRVAVLLIGACLAIVFITAGGAIGTLGSPARPTRRPLPAEDTLAGSTIGVPFGIQWTHALGSRGAVFSSERSSRIEYPGLIPPQGTIEFWIKVADGYHYSNFHFFPHQYQAMIFSSDVQGGDVTWPGATKISVTRYGGVSLWMARFKYNRPSAQATVALNTPFRFGQWHALGFSYGSRGEAIMVDGHLVARAPSRTQTLGAAGNHNSPLDVPTIGETVSHYWQHHRYEGGFDGTLAAFRVSGVQDDWKLALGIHR